MPFDKGSWSSPESSLETGEYCQVCLIDENEPGKEKLKSKCKLPIRSRPGGSVNLNAVHAAAAALAGARGGVGASSESKRKAAKRLIRLYGEADQEPPESLRRLAG